MPYLRTHVSVYMCVCVRPFFKGTLYLVIAISGFIAYHFEVVVLNVQPLPIDVLFDFILYAIPGVM